MLLMLELVVILLISVTLPLLWKISDLTLTATGDPKNLRSLVQESIKILVPPWMFWLATSLVNFFNCHW
ncbi:hypothetical protein SAMN05421755_11403 [Nitrosomonas sp. Nm33]|nr:hypothetical protein SAMN05421755_11403 [Nitrosomonas sp. Nm33]